MRVQINEKTGDITITAKIGEDGGPFASKSGKSVLLASSGGTLATETKYKDYPVSVNVNVMVPNPDAEPVEGKEKKPKVKASI